MIRPVLIFSKATKCTLLSFSFMLKHITHKTNIYSKQQNFGPRIKKHNQVEKYLYLKNKLLLSLHINAHFWERYSGFLLLYQIHFSINLLYD